jgi:hypothetical protein
LTFLIIYYEQILEGKKMKLGTKCPYCGESSMPVASKLYRGSRKAHPCISCGKPVKLSNWARVLGLAWFVSLILVSMALEHESEGPIEIVSISASEEIVSPPHEELKESFDMRKYSFWLSLGITIPIWVLLVMYAIPIRKTGCSEVPAVKRG